MPLKYFDTESKGNKRYERLADTENYKQHRHLNISIYVILTSRKKRLMMKIGIMQPYFIPYIGYWQLMNAVDKYIVHDDVNYIKGGWINRNQILVNGSPKYINILLADASSNRNINETRILHSSKHTNSNLRMIELAYKKAPYFMRVFPLLEDILRCSEENIVSYLMNSFKIICGYLNIKTEMILSSEVDKNCSLRGQDRVLDICESFNADQYYNAIGGKTLYSFRAFEERGIKLCFVQTGDIVYKQFKNEFQSNLSILDVMMFNSQEQIQEMLQQYTLITQ